MFSFQWSLPTNVVFGVGRFETTSKFLRGFGKRALIITSSSFDGGPRAHILKNLTDQLKTLHVEYDVFSQIEPNPRTSTIDTAAAIAREKSSRFVIALGGGSVMDAAKCIAMLALNEGTIMEYAYKGNGQPMKRFNSALPLVCIPTVAATSSETDPYAVVTQWSDALEERRKIAVFGDAMQPALSIIDPALTTTLSAAQTADGVFDTITHVIETYLSTNLETPFQNRMTESVAETVLNALPRAIKNPNDLQARSEISWCSSFALCGAFGGRDGGWPIHAIEHGLSAFTDVSHGRGLAILLPRVMRFDGERVPERIIEFNERVFRDTFRHNAARSVDDALERGLVAYMKRVNIWNTIEEIPNYSRYVGPHAPVKTTEELLDRTIDHALATSGVWKRGENPFLENIVPITRDKGLALLRACLASKLGLE